MNKKHINSKKILMKMKFKEKDEIKINEGRKSRKEKWMK